MSKGPFEASAFIPTEWSTAEDKAEFGNAFLRFVRSEWKRTLFTKKFYTRLSNTFGHIAHYNRDGFYTTWFECDADRLGFLEQTLRYPCYGQPEFTFCDVERAIQIELRKMNLVSVYTQRIAAEVRRQELAELDRLQKKYVSTPAPPGESQAQSAVHRPELLSTGGDKESLPIQGSLF